MSKDHFYFSKSDRIAAILLLFIIIIIYTVRFNIGNRPDMAVAVSDSLEWTPEPRQQPQEYRSQRGWEKDSTVKPANQAQNSRRTESYSGYKRRDTIWIAYERKDSVLPDRFPRKVRPAEPVDLNLADSTMLVSLPGIGAATAARIMRYREQLGGFASVGQLMEIEGLQDSLMQWFAVPDSLGINRIKVNDASLSELRRHPYLNFYQARAIVELRRERGTIKGPGQLSMLDEFSARDLERLSPYLDFD